MIGTLDLSSKSNWQYLDNYTYHPNDDIKVHDTPAADRLARFQFDEVSQLFKDVHINKGDTVTITNLDSTPVGIDLIDLERHRMPLDSLKTVSALLISAQSPMTARMIIQAFYGCD